jgi:hypothetical protein
MDGCSDFANDPSRNIHGRQVTDSYPGFRSKSRANTANRSLRLYRRWGIKSRSQVGKKIKKFMIRNTSLIQSLEG